MSFELSYFGKYSVFLKAAHINSMALEKSHITQKDNYLLVGERSCVCACARTRVRACACVCVRALRRDRGVDPNSSSVHCGALQECSDLEYVSIKFRTAAVDL